MESLPVLYRFRLDDGSVRDFTVHTGPRSPAPPDRGPAAYPGWTVLAHNQCPHCPLDADADDRCPAAVAIADLVEAFDGLPSFETVSLDVETPARLCRFESVSLQSALGSLMGLLLPTSGCPHMAFLQPMARFHLPLSSVEETVYRSASSYLLAQWMRRSSGMGADFDLAGLTRLYERVQVVNRYLHGRLKGAVTSDSSQNAVAMLDVLAQYLPMAVEESLADILPLFSAYLQPNAP